MTELAVAPNVIKPVTLEGGHVRLEPLSLEHVDALVAASSESRDTYGWTFVPDGREAMVEYVTVALEQAAKRQAVPFATLDGGSGRVIGSTRFANFEYLEFPSSSPHYKGEQFPAGVEIGWTWLAASAQRTPINTEAKWLMLKHAFETWNVRVVRLNTDRRNARSRAAIERIGARLDGIMRINRVGSDGAIRDSAAYSMIESEWPEAEAALLARLNRA